MTLSPETNLYYKYMHHDVTYCWVIYGFECLMKVGEDIFRHYLIDCYYTAISLPSMPVPSHTVAVKENVITMEQTFNSVKLKCLKMNV